jgi:hypothetical protein
VLVRDAAAYERAVFCTRDWAARRREEPHSSWGCAMTKLHLPPEISAPYEDDRVPKLRRALQEGGGIADEFKGKMRASVLIGCVFALGVAAIVIAIWLRVAALST